MKKGLVSVLALMTAAAIMGGCGSKKGVGEYVTLGDYSNLEVTMDTVGVDNEEVLSQMNDVYASFVDKEHGGIVDRAVKVGDVVSIDYVGKKDDVAFAGGTAQNQSLEIGSGQYIAGFEEGLVGVMPGKTVDLNLSFPENYGVDELNGQAVVFTVTVNYIFPSGLTVEEMDDSVVASIGIPGVTTSKELEQYVYDWLYSQYEADLQDNIMDILVERSAFEEFPTKVMEPYEQKWKRDWSYFSAVNEASFAAYGISMETYLQMNGFKDADDFIQRNAQKEIQRDSILQAIAAKENIQVEDAELQAWIQKQADKNGFSSADEYKDSYEMDDIKKDCLNDKVLHYLMDNTTVKQAG